MLMPPPWYWHHQPPRQPNVASEFLRLVCLWLFLSAISAPLPGRSGFTLLECSSNRQYHGESRWLGVGSVGWPEMPAFLSFLITLTALSWFFSSTLFFLWLKVALQRHCRVGRQLIWKVAEGFCFCSLKVWDKFCFHYWSFETSVLWLKKSCFFFSVILDPVALWE